MSGSPSIPRTVRGIRVPDRIRWAVDLLRSRPDERLLEIGGGPGVAALLVCDRLRTGYLLEVERSAAAVQRTKARCREHLDAGRLRIRHCALVDLVVPPASFDTAFSIDVNLFWTTRAERGLAVIREALVPGGRLAVLYGATSPDGRDISDRILEPVAAAAQDGGFDDIWLVAEADGAGVLARRPTS